MEYTKFDNFIDSTQYGYTAETTSLVSGDAKYLRITDIVPYFVDKDRVPFCNIDASKVGKYLVHDGDVLIARTGATTGYNLVVDDSFNNYVFASYLIRFNYNRKKLYPRYLKYVLKSPSWYGFVNNYIGGSAQPGMNAKVFGKYYLPYTDLSTQQKIASILSAYDSQIENNQKRIKLLEQIAENLYKEWFVRFRFPGYENAEFEGGMPKGWKVVKVKECVDRLRFGTLYGKDSVESDGDVIVIDQSQEPYIGFHNNAPSHIADTQKPIILFGDHSCKFELMIIPFSLAENVVPFVAKSGIDTIFLYFTTHNLIQTTEYKRHWTEFVNKKILLPPANLQREYAKRVIDMLSMKQQLIIENRLLSKQRDLLLPRLMSGKLSI